LARLLCIVYLLHKFRFSFAEVSNKVLFLIKAFSLISGLKISTKIDHQPFFNKFMLKQFDVKIE